MFDKNPNSNPIEFLIDFAWANGADVFVVNNAKDEYKRLTKIAESTAEETQRWLSCEQELSQLKKVFSKPVAFGKINDRGDLYDLRTQENPFTPPEISVPLYSDIINLQ